MPDWARLRKVFESLSDPLNRVSSLVLKEEQMKPLTKKAAVAVLMTGLAVAALTGCNRGTTTAGDQPAGEATGGGRGSRQAGLHHPA